MGTGCTSASARALGLFLVLVLGCTAERPGVLPPPASGSPTRAASAEPSPLSRTQLAASAVATVRAYYTEVNHAYRTGSTARLRKLSTATCSCLRLVEYIEKAWRQGRLQGVRLDLVDLTPAALAATVVTVRVRYDGRAGRELDRHGKVRKEVPASRGHLLEVTLEKVAGAWLVQDVAVLR